MNHKLGRKAANKNAPLHISQLTATQRAMADQGIRDALLAIVASQGKTVAIPIADANRISDQYRLKVDIGDGMIRLTAEKAELIETPKRN